MSRRKRTQKHRGPEPLGSLMRTELSHLGIESRLREYSITKLWAEVVGPAIAKKTYPRKLLGKKLFIDVASSTWMNELNFHKNEIKEKINSRLGEEAIEEVVLGIGKIEASAKGAEQKRAPRRELTTEEEEFVRTSTDNITDQGLRELLARVIGQSLASEEPG